MSKLAWYLAALPLKVVCIIVAVVLSPICIPIRFGVSPLRDKSFDDEFKNYFTGLFGILKWR